MPYLDELREKLKLVTGDLILETWYDDLHNYLTAIEKNSAVDYVGWMHRDVIPDRDALYNLGTVNLKLKQVYSVYGYFSHIKSGSIHIYNIQTDIITSEDVNAERGNFSEDLRLQGKKVLKDGDPIHIASFYDYAKAQTEKAIENALLNLNVPAKIEKKKVVDVYSFYEYAKSQIEQAIRDTLLNLGIPAKPKLLGYQVNYDAPAMADVFSPNIVVQDSGRVRVKIIGNIDFYSYLKHKLSGVPTEILGLLNTGKPLTKHSWYEFDFTVVKDDEVNVKVAPSTRISIFIYNIPEA